MQFFYYLSVTLLVTKSVTFLHSEISTSLMWNNFCQNREIENFVFCEIKYAFNICEANISQQSYFTWRSQISHAAGVFRWKKTIPKNSLFSGRSGEIWTRGPLNPIQVLYQAEPHPEITCTSIQQNFEFVNPFSKKIYFFWKIYCYNVVCQ